MESPKQFPDRRFLGDRRTQRVYDLRNTTDVEAMAGILQELLDSEAYTCFSPDSLAEARNRGYRQMVV